MPSDRVMTNESIDLSQVQPIWAAIERQYEAYLANHDDGPVLTPRKFDRAQAAGNRTYTVASRYLHVAKDNHDALGALLAGYGLTPWSALNLIRPTFEAAFMALWILDPTEGLDRRRRGLRAELDDQRERENFFKEYEKSPTVGKAAAEHVAEFKADVTPTYASEAHALGVTWQQARQKINMIDELGRLSDVKSEPELSVALKATWRSLSGIQHGLAYSALAGGDIKQRVPIPGGQRVLMTVRDESFVNSATLTSWMFLRALNRWLECGGSVR